MIRTAFLRAEKQIQYYFDIDDNGEHSFDGEGVESQSDEDAMKEAARSACSIGAETLPGHDGARCVSTSATPGAGR
jgi:hypothetical protein